MVSRTGTQGIRAIRGSFSFAAAAAAGTASPKLRAETPNCPPTVIPNERHQLLIPVASRIPPRQCAREVITFVCIGSMTHRRPARHASGGEVSLVHTELQFRINRRSTTC